MFRCSGLEEHATNGDTYFLANHTKMCHFLRILYSVGIKLHLNEVVKNSSFLKMCLGQIIKEKTANESARKLAA